MQGRRRSRAQRPRASGASEGACPVAWAVVHRGLPRRILQWSWGQPPPAVMMSPAGGFWLAPVPRLSCRTFNRSCAGLWGIRCVGLWWICRQELPSSGACALRSTVDCHLEKVLCSNVLIYDAHNSAPISGPSAWVRPRILPRCGPSDKTSEPAHQFFDEHSLAYLSCQVAQACLRSPSALDPALSATAHMPIPTRCSPDPAPAVATLPPLRSLLLPRSA